MSEVSPWFREQGTFAASPSNKILDVIIHGVFIPNVEQRGDLLFEDIIAVKGVGNTKIEQLKAAVGAGIRNVLADAFRFLWVPWEWRKHYEWKELYLKGVVANEPVGQALCSDGSKRVFGGFAVVNEDRRLVFQSAIAGRVTSQRAEAFGLLCATHLAVEGCVRADPARILNAIQMVRSGGVVPGRVLKMNNRSIIRLIAEITNEKNITFEWVKGHVEGAASNKVNMNKAADRYARWAASPPVIQEVWAHADEFFFLWKGNLFEGDIRKKVLHKCWKMKWRCTLRPQEAVGLVKKGVG